MSDLDWARDGATWPNAHASRFVDAAGLRWHVQVMGDGPVALLIHGTGASTHSWRDLLPMLAERFTVIAPDLPGHGFTPPSMGKRMSLPGMAWGVAHLLKTLGKAPAVAVGHSAGAAILARMALDARISPSRLISLNGALLPLPDMPRGLFAPVAGFLASLSPVHRALAWRADRALIDKMLAGTGSVLDERGAALYARLARSPRHLGGALTMMANWDLSPLERDLPRLRPKLNLVVGTADKTIRPSEAERVRRLVAGATIERLEGFGHLAHEERPDLVANLIRRGDPMEAVRQPLASKVLNT